MDLLVGALEGFLEKYETLTLEVSETALIYDGVDVYTHASDQDNLAFIMFRDGIRLLEIDPGIESSEIEALVGCLAHADDLALMEHDLVTSFWDQDFTHIDYKVADPFLGGEVLREGMVDALRETVLQRLESIVAAIGIAEGRLDWERMTEVDPDQVRLEDLALSAADTERGERDVERLDEALHGFTEVLAELAVDEIEQGGAGGCEEEDGGGAIISRPLLESIAGAVKASLDEGDHGNVLLLLSRLRDAGAGAPVLADEIGEVVGSAVTVEHVWGLLGGPSAGAQAGDVVTDTEETTGADLLAEIRPWILRQLLHALMEVQDRGMRKDILGHLGGEEGVPWDHLEPLLKDQRWYVVRNAIQLAAAPPHVQLTEHAQRLLRHSDVRVRREMIRALEKIGGESTLRGAVKALEDEDSSVRVSAARSLGRWGGPEEEALLLARVEDRGFSALPPEEVEALLAAYALLAQERAIPLLDKLRRRKLFGSRPVEFRAAVVASLGYVVLPAAHAVLMEASKSREGPIRRAAVAALQMQAASTTRRSS